jgi:hypothetical protein
LAVGGVAAPIVVARWIFPLSEPLCLLLLACGLPLATGSGARRRWAGLALLLLAVYTRTVALAFLLGVWAVAWRRGERRRVGVELAVVAGALAPWAAWTVLHAGQVPPALYGMYGSYTQWYATSLAADPVTLLLRVPLQNAWLLLVSLGAAVTGYLPAGSSVGALVGVAAAWAIWRSRRASPALLAGLGCYGAVVLLWPYPPFRFVGGVWPLALLAAAAGARSLNRHAVPVVAALALAFAAVGLARDAGVRAGGGGAEVADWRKLEAAIRPLVPAGAVLASSNPALYYLTLGVQGVPNERMRSYRFYRLGYWSTAWGLGDDLWAIIRRYRPTELLVERRGVEGRYAAGSLERQCPGVLTPVWSNPAGEYLFTVHSDVPCAPAAVPR